MIINNRPRDVVLLGVWATALFGGAALAQDTALGRDLERACPISIRTVLTGNGREFTDRLFGLRKRTTTGACRPDTSSGSTLDSRKNHLRKAVMGLLKSWKKMTPHLRNQQVGPTPDLRQVHLRILPKAISGIRKITL